MIRELIARELAIMDGEDWELLGTNKMKLFPFESRAMYLRRADQLFAIREDGCGLAWVKDCEMPCTLDGEGKEKGALQYRKEMGANIVQEVSDG